MSTFSQLPSGKWRAQVRRADIYRAAAFPTKCEAKNWVTQVEPFGRDISGLHSHAGTSMSRA